MMLKKIIDKEYWLLIGNKIIKRKVAQASRLCNPLKLLGDICHIGNFRAVFISLPGDVKMARSFPLRNEPLLSMHFNIGTTANGLYMPR